MTQQELGLVDTVKDYVSDTRHRIQLHDLALQKAREVLPLISDENFPPQTPSATVEEFASRIDRYESIVRELLAIFVIISHWGIPEHILILRKILPYLFERNTSQNGLTIWLNLRYYPAMLLMYSGGIGAIAAGNYENLAAILTTRVNSVQTNGENQESVLEKLVMLCPP